MGSVIDTTGRHIRLKDDELEEFARNCVAAWEKRSFDDAWLDGKLPEGCRLLLEQVVAETIWKAVHVAEQRLGDELLELNYRPRRKGRNDGGTD